ncbi:TetR/AcrR family transcriptional regulator (plasmid) [Rhizobium leguminosarum]
MRAVGTSSAAVSWRERKRLETLRRITDVAMDLFLTQGFEETTLDTIAAAAAISKRTFFYYFTSKEEVLAAWQQGLPKEFKQALLLETPNGSPLDLVYRVQLRLMKDRDTGHARAVNRIIRENENLSASNQVKFLRLEQAVFEALIQLWPDIVRRDELRTVAMVAIGALRLALDKWAAVQGEKPLAGFLDREIAQLKRITPR